MAICCNITTTSRLLNCNTWYWPRIYYVSKKPGFTLLKQQMLPQLFYTCLLYKMTTSLMPLLVTPQLVSGGILWSRIQLPKLPYRDNKDLLAERMRQPHQEKLWREKAAHF